MIPLTTEQQAEVEKLVTAGWARNEAEVLVAETFADDVDEALNVEIRKSGNEPLSP